MIIKPLPDSKFDQIDTNKNGFVSPEEMVTAMIKAGKLKMGSKNSDDFVAAMVSLFTINSF